MMHLPKLNRDQKAPNKFQNSKYNERVPSGGSSLFPSRVRSLELYVAAEESLQLGVLNHSES